MTVYVRNKQYLIENPTIWLINNKETVDFTIFLQTPCFLDLRPGGGLCHILGTAYKFKAEQGWWVVCPWGCRPFTVGYFLLKLSPSFRRRFDLQNPSRTERNVEMFGAIERVLTQVTDTLENTLISLPGTHSWSTSIFVPLQSNCMALPVVYVDPTLGPELASRLKDIISKHKVKCCRREQKMSRQCVGRSNEGENIYLLTYTEGEKIKDEPETKCVELSI